MLSEESPVTVVKKSIDIKAPVTLCLPILQDQNMFLIKCLTKGLATVIPMDVKAGMGVGTTFE